MGRKKNSCGAVMEGIDYDFSVNINPFGTPESIREAVSEASLISFDPDAECNVLKAEFAEKYEISAENIVCCSGVVDLIYRICAACRFKRVLMSVPSFSIYESIFKENNIDVRYLYTSADNNYVLNGEYLDCGDGFDAIIMADPVNPSGAVMGSEELNRLRLWCAETDTILMIDESYMDLVDQDIDENYEASESSEAETSVIIIRSFTKTFALDGIGIGFAFFSNAKIASIVADYELPCSISGVAQRAAEAALKEQEFIDKSVRYINMEREYLLRSLRELGYRCFDSYANYILFIGEKELGEELHREGFLVRDCSEYKGLSDMGEKRYYRVAVRIHRENVLFIDAVIKCRTKLNRAVSIMIQGTMSRVGKTAIASGLCKVFIEDGYRAAVIRVSDFSGGDDQKENSSQEDIEASLKEAYDELAEHNDIVVIDGSASPAEYDTEDNDLDNMKLAEMMNAPVLLVGEHFRGGVLAQIYGTLKLLRDSERERIGGLIVNKFSLDPEKKDSFRNTLKRVCECNVLGVIPFIERDEEDSYDNDGVHSIEIDESVSERNEKTVKSGKQAADEYEISCDYSEPVNSSKQEFSRQGERSSDFDSDNLKKILSKKASAKRRERIRNAEKELEERISMIEEQLRQFDINVDFGNSSINEYDRNYSADSYDGDDTVRTCDENDQAEEFEYEGAGIIQEEQLEAAESVRESKFISKKSGIDISGELRKELDVDGIYRIMGLRII